MRTKYITFAAVLLVLLAGALCTTEKAPKVLDGKVIVMVVAPEQFRDEELFEPYRILALQGARVLVASTSKETAKGMLGRTVDPDITLNEIDVDKLDALIFVGGAGAQIYFDNEKLHELARSAVKKDKVVGAICVAPLILARAGVLGGRLITMWEWKEALPELSQRGIRYTGEKVQVDGKIVTANGPKAAIAFANAISKILQKR